MLNNMKPQLNLPVVAPLDAYCIMQRFDRAINATLQPRFDTLIGKQVLFSMDEKKEFAPLEGWEPRNKRADIRTVGAVDEPAYIAAIDSSCIFIGDTDEGSIYAAKGGLALAFSGRPVMHFKIGPILFYLNYCDDDDDDDSCDGVLSSSRSDSLARFSALDRSIAKRIIRARVERLIQNEISKYLHNSVILVDGSLRSSVFEDRNGGLHHVIKNCGANKNFLIGISKTTRLKPLDQLASLLMQKNQPCYIDVESIVRLIVSNVAGRPLLAKLSNDGLVLRADVLGDPQESLGRLLGNDVLAHGYPETLRLAHHVSIFTRMDALCIRGFILGQLNTREVASEDVRRTLLGSLGTGGLRCG